MGFSKAQSQQAFIKASLYGPPGSGKTMTGLLFAEGLAKKSGKKIAFIDTERGTDFYSIPVKQRTVHADAFEFDALYTRSLSEILSEIKKLDTAQYGVLVIDSISHVWDSAIEAYGGTKVGKKADKIPLQAWADIKRPFKEMMKLLVALNAHVIILGRQKSIFEKDEDDDLVKVGVGIRSEGETQFEPHLCARLEQKFSTQDQTQSTVYMYVEKDRSSVLHGRTVLNPKFDTIAPMLDVLLAKVQAPAEDEAARIQADSEIAEKQAKEAEVKSLALYEEHSKALLEAADIAALGKATAAIGKVKKSLSEEHLEALKIQLENAKKRITEGAVKAI